MTSDADWSEERARALIDAHRMLDGPLLPVLHALQGEFGRIPPAAIPLVAETLNLSRADVHGVISFYHDFRTEPAGRHVLKLCRAEACQALGADALAEAARRRLGLDWGETTANRAVTLEPVFCLGLCAVGPAALWDGAVLGRLDPARLDALIDAAGAA